MRTSRTCSNRHVRLGAGRRGPRRLVALLAASALAVPGVLVSSAAPALAGSSVGSFEIDGNLVDSPAGEPIDWSTPPPNLTNFADDSGSNDDAFGQGSKEQDTSTWKCVLGGVPTKDDLVNGQISFRTVNGKQFVYVDYTRAGTNGDAHIDYEFNQSSATLSGSCAGVAKRTNGDIVLTFDTNNGGKSISVRAFSWTFASGSTSAGTFSPLAVGSQGKTWDGAVNIPNSIPGHTDGDFGEAALNLTDTIGNIACGQFAGAFMKTRAATSISAELKDRTASQPVDVGACPSSSLAKAVRNITTGGVFATSASAKPSDTLEYQLTYANNGQAPATNVTVTDPVPANTSFLSCSNTCSSSGGTLSWSLGTVNPGQSVAVTFQVKVAPTFTSNSILISNTGTVSTKEEGSKPSNPVTVTGSAPPSSSLAKAVRDVTTNTAFGTSTPARPGDRIQYRLSYANNGTGPASNVTVTEAVPASSTFAACSDLCTVSGSTVTWSLGTIAAGGSKVVTLDTTLDSTFTSGSVTIPNTAQVSTAQEGTRDSNPAQVNVTAAPKTSLAKAVRNVTANGAFSTTTAAKPADQIEYRLTYNNSGSGPASNVTVTETVPQSSTFVSCTLSCTKTGTTPGSTVTWSLGSVPAGQTIVMLLDTKLDSTFSSGSATIANVANATTTEEGTKPSNQTTVTVTAPPASSLAKAVRNVTQGTGFGVTTTAGPGQQIEYRLTYNNGGSGPASNVTITEAVPQNSTFVSCSASCTKTGTAAGSTVTWSLGSVPAGQSVAVLLDTLLDATFTQNTVTITNVAYTSSTEEPTPKPSNPATVTVSAQPNSSLAKAVRNVTTNGAFATSATASPRDQIEYRLTYSNLGSGPATTVTITEVVPPSSSFVSCSDGCTTSGTSAGSVVTWKLGTIAAGGTKAVLLDTVLAAAFGQNSTTIANIAHVSSDQEPTGKDSNQALVTVTAAPVLTLAKKADQTVVGNGSVVTYTLTYSNTGTAPATGTVVTETIPNNTTFASCSNSCVKGGTTPGSVVTWSVGTLKPGDSGFVTLSVTVGSGVGCTLCNIASIASADAGQSVSSNQLCVDGIPAPNPSTAKASGAAFAVELSVKTPVTSLNQTLAPTQSAQTGPGVDSRSGQVDALPPVDAGILQAKVLTTTSTSKVTSQPLQSDDVTTAEAANVCLLPQTNGPCVVAADLVRAVAEATASGGSAGATSVGSTITNLVINGQPIPQAQIYPGAEFTLPAAVFGTGSKVVVYQRTTSVHVPDPAVLNGGTYDAAIDVTMIHLLVTDLAGTSADISVSHAHAFASFAQTALCARPALQSVSGHALVASEQTTPTVLPVVVGYVTIPASGGHDATSADANAAPILTTSGGSTDSTGSIDATSSSASSRVNLAKACLLITAGACTIDASVVTVQSGSSATSGARSSTDSGTSMLVTINGTTIPGTPAANTTYDQIPGITLILNEQVCDNSTVAPPGCSETATGHAGLTVRAIHLIVSGQNAFGLPLGVDVVVAEAHSDATYRSV